MNKRTDTYRFGANAFNIGYRDQRYTADYTNGKLTVSGLADSIPSTTSTTRRSAGGTRATAG